MLADEPANQFPHPFALKLEAITIKPVPLFNRTKCAPIYPYGVLCVFHAFIHMIRVKLVMYISIRVLCLHDSLRSS